MDTSMVIILLVFSWIAGFLVGVGSMNPLVDDAIHEAKRAQDVANQCIEKMERRKR